MYYIDKHKRNKQTKEKKEERKNKRKWKNKIEQRIGYGDDGNMVAVAHPSLHVNIVINDFPWFIFTIELIDVWGWKY